MDKQLKYVRNVLDFEDESNPSRIEIRVAYNIQFPSKVESVYTRAAIKTRLGAEVSKDGNIYTIDHHEYAEVYHVPDFVTNFCLKVEEIIYQYGGY
ncbi:MAG: hypothetical protein QHH15_00390 [Candidatus Thermoplasmatota archaeon]|nr:hypothetical protein [Candidatus Thermoplasmatota archaeon]MDH7506232.1 hypothetical protein [Candidatus Thermoplasmatota archaeon]